MSGNSLKDGVVMLVEIVEDICKSKYCTNYSTFLGCLDYLKNNNNFQDELSLINKSSKVSLVYSTEKKDYCPVVVFLIAEKLGYNFNKNLIFLEEEFLYFQEAMGIIWEMGNYNSLRGIECITIKL